MFTKRTFLFDADGGGGGGGDDDPPNDPPADPQGDDDKEQTRTFKQSELDAMFASRATQAAQSAVKKLVESLGVRDKGELEAMIKKAKEAEAANLSELEKAQKAAEDAKKEVEQAKTQAEEVKAQAAEALLKAAVISAASAFNDPNDAWLYLDRDKIEPKEDGTGYDGLEAELKRIGEEKPYLLKSDDQQPPPKGTPPRQRQQRRQQRQSENNEPEKPVIRM